MSFNTFFETVTAGQAILLVGFAWLTIYSIMHLVVFVRSYLGYSSAEFSHLSGDLFHLRNSIEDFHPQLLDTLNDIRDLLSDVRSSVDSISER